MATKTEKDEQQREALNPEEIVFNEEPETTDDADMPRPETKEYAKYLKVSDRFMALFHRCVDALPYNTLLRTEDQQIRLIDLVRFVEAKRDKVKVEEMNLVITYIANTNFAAARPLMEIVENKEAQSTLWTIFEE